MNDKPRLTIGVLTGYEVYGCIADSQTIEGNTITDYLLRVHQGILAAGKDFDCNLLIGCGYGKPPTPDYPFPAWFNWADDSTFVPVGPWNTDGLILLTPIISDQRQQLIRELRGGGFPVVACGSGLPAPAVMADDASGIHQAVTHLCHHGHRRIAYIAGYENKGVGDSTTRFEAFHTAMHEMGLDVLPELIAYGFHTIQGGITAMEKLLESGQQFTAIVTSDYSSAMGALRVLRQAGRRVPEDVALIGFDDYLDARAQIPPVTTVHMQWSEMGYQSVKLLLDYVTGKRSELVVLRVPGQLVVRHSCGCADGDESYHPETTPPSETELAHQMADAALREAYHLKQSEFQTWCENLIRALLKSLRENEITHFNSEVDILLDLISGEDDDVYALQDALGVLSRNLSALGTVLNSEKILMLAEELIDGARLHVSEISRAQAAQNLVRRANMSDALGAMTQRLLSTLDEAEIPDILSTHLPRIGISHAEIFMLERDEDDPAAWSLLQGQEWNKDSMRRFHTTGFPPPGLYPAGKAYRSVILPLVCRDEQVGYVAFETDDLEPLAAITQHVSAAILGARLYRESQEGRQLAESANRLKTRFLSTVSHELRVPLNLIVGLSELLLREQQQGKTLLQQDLERIYSNSRHLGFLIRDVLDLASSDAGQLHLALEPLDLNNVLATVGAIGEQMVGEKGLSWQAKFPQPGPQILGDQARLQQVLLNFISNAVKFTAKGSVMLQAVVEGGQVVVSVIDTGVGIPVDELESIFDEFHQSERTASRGFGGMGLGLAISRHLIELHGGYIGARSSGVEGEGATLYFTLPLLERPAVPALPLLPDSNVLLITDQVGRTDQLREALASQGYTADVRIMDNEMKWLATIINDPPSALLLDHHLVGRHGWKLLEGVWRNTRLQNKIPVLFYALPEGEKAGAVFALDYQTKPLQTENLREIFLQTSSAALQVILLVDDDQSVLDLHTRMIQSHLPECRVVHAHNGRDALQVLDYLTPDLILLDLMMPELDGFGVLRVLQERESTRGIPVIILTAKSLTEEDMEKMSQGVAAILEKGVFSNDDTVTRIVEILSRKIRSGTASQRLVRQAMAYIHTHYGEAISRTKIASHLAVSENYLTNCFQKEIGFSPIAYINRYRVRQACVLLEKGELNITEVALAVGYSDHAYFSKVFQREMGISPSAYRTGSRIRIPIP